MVTGSSQKNLEEIPNEKSIIPRVSVQGVESLWGDCRMQIYSGRLGVIVVNLCQIPLFEDFLL